jgi:hypothetical protein
MDQSNPKPPRNTRLSELQLELMRNARDHGNIFHTADRRRHSSLQLAIRRLLRLEYVMPGTGELTPAGLEALGKAEAPANE